MIESNTTSTSIISHCTISSLFKYCHTMAKMANCIEICCNIIVNLINFYYFLSITSCTIENISIQDSLGQFIHWSHICCCALLCEQACNFFLRKTIDVSQTYHRKVVLSTGYVLTVHYHAIACKVGSLLDDQLTCIQQNICNILLAVPCVYC